MNRDTSPSASPGPKYWLRRDVGEVVLDDRAREAVLPGEVDGAARRIERGLAVMLFCWPGDDVVAHAEVERQARRRFPVILRENTVLEITRSEEAALRTDAVIVDEPGQQFCRLVAGKIASANDAVDYVFGGLTPDGMPLIRARVFTGNVYSLELKQ